MARLQMQSAPHSVFLGSEACDCTDILGLSIPYELDVLVELFVHCQLVAVAIITSFCRVGAWDNKLTPSCSADA